MWQSLSKWIEIYFDDKEGEPCMHTKSLWNTMHTQKMHRMKYIENNALHSNDRIKCIVNTICRSQYVFCDAWN